MNKNSVMFKRGRDAILVILDPDADFDSLREVLEGKVGEAARFFGGSSSALSFVGRELTEEQEKELLDILVEKSNLDITVILRNEAKKKAALAEAQEKPPQEEFEDPNGRPSTPRPTGYLVDLAIKLPGRDREGIPQPKPNAPFNPAEHITKYQKGSLRSGQIIRFRGSVVVLGDVNPGAEILAEGNVIVLGSLKGLVHAGCMGDQDCYIGAISLMPSQLRIADKITYMPKEMSKDGSFWGGSPQYAFISDGQIYIAPLLDD